MKGRCSLTLLPRQEQQKKPDRELTHSPISFFISPYLIYYKNITQNLEEKVFFIENEIGFSHEKYKCKLSELGWHFGLLS
jgi:hypothetical protein